MSLYKTAVESIIDNYDGQERKRTFDEVAGRGALSLFASKCLSGIACCHLQGWSIMLRISTWRKPRRL